MFDNQTIRNNVKDLMDWRTKRKVIVFSVDDYGNVRLDSNAAREALKNVKIFILMKGLSGECSNVNALSHH